MLGKILKLFVGDKSKKDLKEINPIINQIHSYQDEMNKLSNDELRQKTEIFKKLIKDSIPFQPVILPGRVNKVLFLVCGNLSNQSFFHSSVTWEVLNSSKSQPR